MIAEQLPTAPMTHEQRAQAFREAINQIRAAAHVLLEAELFGALDETSRFLNTLEKQREIFLTLDGEPKPQRTGHKGRRVGIDIIPGSVKLARTESGLSLRQLGAGHLTGAGICLVEHGKCRPSMSTLQLIATRTGKSLDFFIAKTPWNQFAATIGVELPAEVQA